MLSEEELFERLKEAESKALKGILQQLYWCSTYNVIALAILKNVIASV